MQYKGPHYLRGVLPDGTWAMIELNPISQDQRTIAERKWQSGLKPAKPQQPCDVGMFGDDANQLDLVEMLQDPDPQ